MTPSLAPASCKVHTPAILADAMVEALGDRPGASWLDPCVGGGAFPQALAKLGVPARQIIALDIDREPVSEDVLSQAIRGVDFLAWSQTTGHRFDRIVCNPPFVALSKLDPRLLKTASTVRLPDGSSIVGTSNYWCPFVWASLRLLRTGGAMCFVLPAAFDYADYAAPLRNLLPQRFERFEVYRSRRPAFKPIQDGSVVVVGRGFARAGDGDARRFEYDSPDELIKALPQSDKNIPSRGQRRSPRPRLVAIEKGTRKLGDVVRIRLGGVTGDARYFLLTEAQRQEQRLPVDVVRPVLSRARHLVAGEMSRDEWLSLRDGNERVWLFDPPRRLVEHPSVSAYLNLDPSSGGCMRSRYKISSRTPWYRVPLPKRVDGFITGMSQFGPWISLRAMPSLTATNTLYVVTYRDQLSRDGKAAWAMSLLTSGVRRTLKPLGRLYADGLLKYEPGDLLGLPVPIPRRMEGAAEFYLQVVKALLRGEVEKSRAMADSWFDWSGDTVSSRSCGGSTSS